jgi:tetratricopeptide (TPR) repeat protein
MLELGASGHGDAAELMTLIDCNTDGSVSLDEFTEFRRRVAVLRQLPGADRRMHQQLSQAWAHDPEQAGEVAQATFRPLDQDTSEAGREREREAGGHGTKDADSAGIRGLCEEWEQQRGEAARGREAASGVGGARRVVAQQETGVEARGLRQQVGRSVSVEGGGLDLLRSPQVSSSQQVGAQGPGAASSRRGAAALRGFSAGAGSPSSGLERSRAVGGSGNSRGGAATAVARRGGYEELVEELRQRGGRARQAWVDEEEFVVEKGSDLDRKLSHYEASSTPTNGAAKPTARTSSPADSAAGVAGASGGDRVLTRQELNRRLAGIPDGGPPQSGVGPAGRGGGARGGREEDRRDALTRALRRVERQLAAGLYDEGRTLLNVLVERHAQDGRLWLHYGRLENQDPHGGGAHEVYERARAYLLREAAELEERREGAAEQGRSLDHALAEVEAALARGPAPGPPARQAAAGRARGQRRWPAPQQPSASPSGAGEGRKRAPIVGETPLQRRLLGGGRGWEAVPPSGAQLHQLALSLVQQGNAARARSLLLQGLQAAPRDVVLRLTLARLEADAGNETAAREHYRVAAADAPANVLCWQVRTTARNRWCNWGVARLLMEWHGHAGWPFGRGPPCYSRPLCVLHDKLVLWVGAP